MFAHAKTSASEGRANRQQAAEEARNRSQIDRVIRNLQNRGYNIQVINDAQGARAYQSQNPNGGVRSGNRSAAYSNNQKGTPSSRRSNTSSSNTSYSRSNANRSSSSGNSSNYRSSPSRSYSAPEKHLLEEVAQAAVGLQAEEVLADEDNSCILTYKP